MLRGLANKVWTGDFDKMLERRMIRVLVPRSRTLYYSDRGRERGVTAELIRHLEPVVNKKYAKELGRRPLTFYIVPTTRDKLISGVVEGHGGINNVELVTAEKIGTETTTYVRNIYKYYVADKLTLEHAELQKKLREQMQKGS